MIRKNSYEVDQVKKNGNEYEKVLVLTRKVLVNMT